MFQQVDFWKIPVFGRFFWQGFVSFQSGLFGHFVFLSYSLIIFLKYNESMNWRLKHQKIYFN